LDVVQLQLLFFLGDRGSILTELVNRVDCLRRVGRAKKHPLELRKLREKFVVQVEQQARVLSVPWVISEEQVGLIDNQAPQRLKVNHFLVTEQGTLEGAERSDDNVSVINFTSEGVIADFNVRKLGYFFIDLADFRT